MGLVRRRCGWAAIVAMVSPLAGALSGCGGASHPAAADMAGAPAALLTLADGSSFDFGTQAIGSTSEHTVTLANGGGRAATALVGSTLSLPFAWKGGTFPGQGGSCGASLDPGASCTLVLAFTPADSMPAQANAGVSYADGLAASPVTVTLALTGRGTTHAFLALSDSPSYDYGTQVTGSTTDHAFTLTNTGGSPASAIAAMTTAPFAFPGGAFPGGGNCGATLAAGANCTVVLRFAPTSSGPASGRLDLQFSDGSGPATTGVALAGAATLAALITLSDGATFDYGVVATTAFADHTFQISNRGGTPATGLVAGTALAAPFAFVGNAYPGGGTCLSTLAPGATCTVVVRFAPAATGPQLGTLELDYSDGAQAQVSQRALAGTGAAPALLSLSDAPTYDYGTRAQASATDHTFTLTNVGGVAAIALGAPTAGGAFRVKSTSCGSTLSVHATCSIAVTFTAGSGSANGSLSVVYSDGASATANQLVSVALRGAGTSGPALDFQEGTAFDFGTRGVGVAVSHLFTLENRGGAASTGLSVTVGGSGFSVSGTSCGTTLLSGAACTVTVSWTPTAGPAVGTLGASDAASVSASLALSGSGTSAAFLAAASPVDFGMHTTGTTTPRTLTVTNTGGAPSGAIGGSSLSGGFGYTGGGFPGGGDCGPTLAVGASCTVGVSFAPGAPGPASANLSLSYSGGTLGIVLQGVATAPARLTLSDGPTYDYGTHAIGSSSDQTFTLINQGASAASLSSEIATGPFQVKSTTCGAALAPADRCTVTVTFSPTTTGSAMGALTVAYDDGAATQRVTRMLLGAGAAPALLSLTPPSTVDFGTVAVGATVSRTFTLGYVSGGVPAVGIGTLPLPSGFALTGGTCASTLSSGSCTFVVSFTPTAPTGSVSGSFAVYYDSGAASQQLTTLITADAEMPASITIAGAPLYDFGTHANGSIATRSFDVTNSGGLTGKGMQWGSLTAPFAYEGGTFPGTTGTCSASLAPAASCKVVVTFSPTGSGTMSYGGDLTLAYLTGAGNGSTHELLAGTGAPPASLAVQSSSPFAFGPVAQGGSLSQTFTVKNLGGVPAVLGSGAARLDQNVDFQIIADTCSSKTIAAGGTCDLTFRFAPTFSSGATVTANLALAYNNGLAAASAGFQVTGIGVAPALLVIAPAPFDYRTHAVGSTTDQLFSVTYSGGVPATGVLFTAPTGYSIQSAGTTCQSTVSASCAVLLRFAPNSAGVTYAGNLAAGYSDGTPTSRSASAAVTGVGAAPALFTISDGATFDYGVVPIGAQRDKTFTVTNSGGVAGSLTTADAGGLPYSVVSSSGCASLAAGASGCQVVVRFKPTASATSPSTLTLNYDSGAGSASATRPLSGTGRLPAHLAFADAPSYDYGSIKTGGTADHVFWISNDGELAAASVGPAAFGTSAFNWKSGTFPGFGGNCGATLPAGATCRVVVTFTAPTMAGPTTDVITLGYDSQLAITSATLPVRATATQQAFVRITDFPPTFYTLYGIPPDPAVFDFGTVAVNQPAQRTFSLTNTGGGPAAITPPGPLGGGFAWKGGGYPGQGGTCASTLAAGAVCTVVVSFTPVSSSSFSSSFSVGYNDGLAAQTATRPLTGTGTAYALLVLSDFKEGTLGAAFDFGLVGVGQSQGNDFYLVNQGNVTATNLVFSTATASFTVDASRCGTQLTPGGYCRPTVRFKPQALGPLQDSVQVAYSDGSGAPPPPAKRALRGTGTNAAVLVIQAKNGPATVRDFGTHGVGSSTSGSFQLVNSGGVSATSIAFPAAGAPWVAGQPFFYQPGTCGASLAAGGACSFTVVYAPTAAGGTSATAALGYSDGTASQSTSVALTGNAISTALLAIEEQVQNGGGDLSNAPFDYGTRGAASSQQFKVTNNGGAAATVNGGSLGGLFSFFQAAGPAAFPGATAPSGSPAGTCVAGGNLAAGASCTLFVTFTPTGTQASSTSLSVSYLDTATSASLTATRDLTGVSSQSALVILTNNGFCATCSSDLEVRNFGTVGIPTDLTFYLQNRGAAAATNLTFGTSGGAFTIQGAATDCVSGGTLAALTGQCRVTVTYTPSSTSAGPESGVLHIGYLDGANPAAIDKSLTGTATLGPLLVVSPCQTCTGDPSQNYDFGTAGARSAHTFTAKNIGRALAQSIGGVGFVDPVFHYPGGFPGQPASASTCGASLASGASCQFTVEFVPNPDTAQHADSLSLSYTGGPTAPIGITGTDTNVPLLSVSEFPFNPGGTPSSPFDFGTSGVSVKHTFYVTNSGVGATNLAFAFSPSDAVYGYPASSDLAACVAGGTLAAGASCTLQVAFTPPTGAAADTAVHSSAIQVSYAGASSPASRAIQGTDSNAPILSILDCQYCGGPGGPPLSPFDFGLTGGSISHTFTAQNTGGATATLSSSLSQPAGGTYYSFAGGFPGTGGTCATGGALAPGAACTFVVTFARNAADSGTLVKSGSVTIGSPNTTRQLTAAETDNAIVTIADCQFCGGGSSGPPFDYGVWGQKSAQLFWVSNSGAQATTLSAGAFTGTSAGNFAFTGSGFPGAQGNCSAALNGLAAGASCSIEIAFNPAGAPSTSPPTTVFGTVNLNFTNGGPTSSASRNLQAAATASANLYLTDNGPFNGGNFQSTQFDYGTSGAASTRLFWVTNTGPVDATVTTPTPIGANFAYATSGVFPGAGGSCSNTIKAGSSCTVAVTFTPTSPPLADQQQVSGTLSLSYSGGPTPASPATRGLLGRYTSQPIIGIADCPGCGPAGVGNPPFDYGHFGAPRLHTFYVTNSGGGAAPLFATSAIGAHFLYSAPGFPGGAGSCPTSGPGLGAGQTCRIEVEFDPTGAPQGPFGGTITLGYGSQTSSRAVTGTAEPGVYLIVAANSAGWQPNPFDYGTWGPAAPATLRRNQFWVTNQGGTNATPTGGITGPFTFAGGGFPGSGGSCTGAIGPAQTQCSVTVEFDPAAGVSTGALDIGYSGGPSTAASLNLSGTYTASAFVVVSENSNVPGFCGDACGSDFFGTYPAGTTPVRNYWVTSTGNVATGALAPQIGYAAPFGTPSPPPSECTTAQLSGGLAPGQQCTLSVQFTAPASSSGLSWTGKIGVSGGFGTATRSFRASEQ